ncbi:MAG TPA: amidophosphoribosyltransferase [Syntrophorhabdaceae bacterium]|nr:amidophosphoribosyltransferase [Syntrophorhabdaceae bacterium]
MCGIFGIYNHKDAANIVYLGLYALQHRGQESAGIACFDKSKVYSYKQMGLVSEVFTQDVLKKLAGNKAIGHVRYSTHGASDLKNSQPIVVEYQDGYLALVHNGNLTNANIIRDELRKSGAIFQTTTDTEVIIHIMARSKEHSAIDRFIDSIHRFEGSYSIILLTQKELIAARDPFGIRPLCLGRLRDSYVISSETCAFDLIEAEFLREIEPGEILVINKSGIKSIYQVKKTSPKFCIFEFIYFARPDSFMFGKTVYTIRKAFGRELAKGDNVEADMVIPIPDSGIGAAIGYSQESRIPFELGLIRNHYVGRTFIEPEPSIRHFGVKLKHNAIHDLVKGKRLIVIDDSIVRATTSRKIISMLKYYGAEEIHFRVSSPPTKFPCFYGIDTPSRKQLIASSHSIEEIKKYMGCDSLRYLSKDAMKHAVGDGDYTFCDACFTGEYIIKFPMDMSIEQMELFSDKTANKEANQTILML